MGLLNRDYRVLLRSDWLRVALCGRAKEAERALEEACLARFGTARREGSRPVIRSDNRLIFRAGAFAPRAAMTVCVRSSLYLTRQSKRPRRAVFGVSRRSASGCITSAVSPKRVLRLPGGLNGTTPGVLTSHSAIAARISFTRYNPNSWLDTRGGITLWCTKQLLRYERVKAISVLFTA